MIKSNGDCAKTGSIPWLEGPLLAYLRGKSVLDIKAPGETDTGPVTPGATIYQMESGETDSLAEFPRDASFDAIFARYALAYAAEPAQLLRSWFERVRQGGILFVTMRQTEDLEFPKRPLETADLAAPEPHLLVALPEMDAISAPVPLADIAPTMTADAFLRLAETALGSDQFKLEHHSVAEARRFDAGISRPSREISLVIRKIAAEHTDNATTPVARGIEADIVAPPIADLVVPFVQIQHTPLKNPGLRVQSGFLIRDFAPPAGEISKIIVLKLDHHGDFVIGLPALHQLRQAFPKSYIRLVCGTWNVAAARNCGLLDDVRAYNYFPERASEWTGSPPVPGWDQFAAAVEGRFDLAIDLRVDEDTRALLGRIDAAQRCGIGSNARFPKLDIALPDGSREPRIRPVFSHADFSTTSEGSQILEPDAFDSIMERKTPEFHETGFASRPRILLKSGLFAIPQGEYSAEFYVETRNFVPGIRPVGLDIGITDGRGQQVAKKVFGRRKLASVNAHVAKLRFSSSGGPTSYEFYVKTEGRPISGRIRFAGMRLRRLDANGARFSPSELHVGEKLSLLVSLIIQRTLPLPAPAWAGLSDGPSLRLSNETAKTIVIAPFSNSAIRDWPARQYAKLIDLILENYGGDCVITLIGAPSQLSQAAKLVALIESDLASTCVVNLVGKTSWSAIPDILRSNDLVICNNSGVAHQAAQIGANTLAIYSASHQPLEWGPRGRKSRAIMASVACSPCGFERLEDCMNDHLCMRLLTPSAVFDQVHERLMSD